MEIINLCPDHFREIKNRMILNGKQYVYTVEKNSEKKTIKTKSHFLYAKEICSLLGLPHEVRTPRIIMDKTNFPKYYYAGNRRVYSLDQFLYIYLYLVLIDLTNFLENKPVTLRRGLGTYILKYLYESHSKGLLKRLISNLNLLLEEFSNNGAINFYKLFDLFKNKVIVQPILVENSLVINIFINKKFISIDYLGDNVFAIKKVKNVNEKNFYIKEGK